MRLGAGVALAALLCTLPRHGGAALDPKELPAYKRVASQTPKAKGETLKEMRENYPRMFPLKVRARGRRFTDVCETPASAKASTPP